MAKSNAPSLALLGNLFSLLAINGVLIYAFVDQFFLGELPCPLCIMQRIGFILVGFAIVLNLRFGGHSAHYGWGILSGLVGMMISLRQVLLHILPNDTGYGATFLGMHFYTWGFIGFTGLLIAQATLLILPNRDVRSRHWFVNFSISLFIFLVLANLLSTLLECGVGPCEDDPIKYQGLLWLRSRFGF
jgi:disulfide bond formation protein DsbB